MSHTPVHGARVGTVSALVEGVATIDLDDGGQLQAVKKASGAPVVVAGQRVLLARSGDTWIVVDTVVPADDAALPANMAVGTVAITPSAADTTTIVAVSFGPLAGAGTTRVYVTIASTANVEMHAYAGNITPTGADIGLRAGNTTQRTVQWLAIREP